MRRPPLILLFILLALAGCQSCPVAPPKVVHVTVEKIVKVPAELSVDCDPVPKRENSLGEAVRLANSRGASLAECNARMARIRSLGEGD